VVTVVHQAARGPMSRGRSAVVVFRLFRAAFFVVGDAAQISAVLRAPTAVLSTWSALRTHMRRGGERHVCPSRSTKLCHVSSVWTKTPPSSWELSR